MPKGFTSGLLHAGAFKRITSPRPSGVETQSPRPPCSPPRGRGPGEATRVAVSGLCCFWAAAVSVRVPPWSRRWSQRRWLCQRVGDAQTRALRRPPEGAVPLRLENSALRLPRLRLDGSRLGTGVSTLPPPAVCVCETLHVCVTWTCPQSSFCRLPAPGPRGGRLCKSRGPGGTRKMRRGPRGTGGQAADNSSGESTGGGRGGVAWREGLAVSPGPGRCS